APLQLSHVDPAIISVWRWHSAFRTLLYTAIAGAFCFPFPVLWPLAPLLAAVGGVCLMWRWPPLSYRYLRYGIDDTGIAIERGVLWRSRIALPRVRIQHTDVSQGPLERRYGIGTLQLYTAG